MAWSAKFPGETLVHTFTGQPTISLGGGTGVRQIPIDPVEYGVPVPADFATNYKGMRVVVEFTMVDYVSPSSWIWFGYAYLNDSIRPSNSASGPLGGNLSTGTFSSTSQFSATFDAEFNCTRFVPSPEAYVTWSGSGSAVGVPLGNGAFPHSEPKSEFSPAFFNIYMGQSSVPYNVQVTAAYVSYFPTVDTPEAPNTPSIYPTTGTYQGVQLAVIRSASTVYYTLDGSTPTTSSLLYTGPVRISQDSVLRAVAYSNGLYSPVSEAVYLLKGADYQRIPSYSAALLPKLLYQYQGDNP